MKELQRRQSLFGPLDLLVGVGGSFKSFFDSILSRLKWTGSASGGTAPGLVVIALKCDNTAMNATLQNAIV